MAPMLVLELLAALQAAAAPLPATAVRSDARVSVRIVRGARVESGRTAEPHRRGRALIADAPGERRTIELIEFQ